jgi:hypothetical protein
LGILFVADLYCLLVGQEPAAIIGVEAFIAASYLFAFRSRPSLFEELSFKVQVVWKEPLNFAFNATAMAAKNYLLTEFY